MSKLILEVFEREIVAPAHFFSELLGLFDIHVLADFIDKRNDVAHAEDSAGHGLRIKALEAVEFFAHTHEFDGLAGDHADGKRRTASGVAVDLGENHAGEREFLAEGFGSVDRVLTDHGVDHEEGLDRIQEFFQIADLIHHLFVDR